MIRFPFRAATAHTKFVRTLCVAALTAMLAAPAARARTTQNFTVGMSTFVVPVGVTSLNISLFGGGGGIQSVNGAGGSGGSLTATLSNLTAGTTLSVIVGAGGRNTLSNNSGGSSLTAGDRGGEYSAISFGTGAVTTGNLLALAGGGGGGGNLFDGGAGGGTSGATGSGGSVSGGGGS